MSTVGTLKTGPAYVPASWQNHEGHPGWRIDQLDEPTERAKWVATNPDIITIHLGTNDCYQNYQPATLATKMRSLLVCVQVRGIRSLGPQWHGMVWCGVVWRGTACVMAWHSKTLYSPNLESTLTQNHTFEQLPKTHVFLASILLMPTQGTQETQGTPGQQQPSASLIAHCGTDFNQMVPTIVNEYAAAGHSITYVPMAESTGLCTMGTPDEGLCAGGHVHPISAGYLRMASAWSYSILNHYKPDSSKFELIA